MQRTGLVLRCTQVSFIRGKGHPTTRPCRHREKLKEQLQPIRNFGTRRWWVVSTAIRPLYPWEREPVPSVQEAEWASGPDCTPRKISPPPGFYPRTVQPQPVAITTEPSRLPQERYLNLTEKSSKLRKFSAKNRIPLYTGSAQDRYRCTVLLPCWWAQRWKGQEEEKGLVGVAWLSCSNMQFIRRL